MSRARERGGLDRFEQEKVTFFEKVRAGYQHLWEQYPERVKRLGCNTVTRAGFCTSVAIFKLKISLKCLFQLL